MSNLTSNNASTADPAGNVDNVVLIATDPDNPAIGIVTINNERKRGALSKAVMTELIAAFTSIGERTDIRTVILRSAGAKVFSSGHDLSEIRGAEFEDQQQLFELCAELMLLIQTIPQPVIAQVQGLATAAGCQLVATCDLAVAADNAHFATPGVQIGLFCSTPMVALTRAVDRKTAMRMLLTGDLLNAQDALIHGLVSHVIEADQLEAETLRVAGQVAKASSATVAIGKQAFYDQINLDTAAAYEKMADVMAHNAVIHDAQEGIGAFLEKREPVWQHRQATE